jgi:hypothetical protein
MGKVESRDAKGAGKLTTLSVDEAKGRGYCGDGAGLFRVPPWHLWIRRYAGLNHQNANPSCVPVLGVVFLYETTSIKRKGMAQSATIPGSALRARIDKLGLTYTEAALRLGLTLDGLQKQMRGARKVSRQTEIILGYLEKELKGPAPEKEKRRGLTPVPLT